jgi:hypothetical protein
MKPELTTLILEWAGSVSGLVGAFLLATHTKFSKYGWIGFALANIFTAAMALMIERNGLLTQQIGFVLTSALGMYRAGLLPWKPAQSL